MNIRSFTPQGIDRARLLLDDMKSGLSGAIPSGLLNDPELSHDTGISIDKPPDSFESRYLLALWLNKQLDHTPLVVGTPSAGTWTWLALAFLDVIAPLRADGTRKIGDLALYILEPANWRRYYRHLLAGPVRVMRAHWAELHITQPILAGRPNVPGDFYEQIASRQEVVTSPSVVSLIRRLYWDAPSKSLKKGAASKGAGGSRRLIRLLDQLDVNWDFEGMSGAALFGLVPKREYARFMKQIPSEDSDTT